MGGGREMKGKGWAERRADEMSVCWVFYYTTRVIAFNLPRFTSFLSEDETNLWVVIGLVEPPPLFLLTIGLL